jgi:hypothetical protein
MKTVTVPTSCGPFKCSVPGNWAADWMAVCDPLLVGLEPIFQHADAAQGIPAHRLRMDLDCVLLLTAGAGLVGRRPTA